METAPLSILSICCRIETMNGDNGNDVIYPIAKSARARSPGVTFQRVKTTRTSAQLTWTPVDNGTRYLVFSQEIYGVYSTRKNRFKFVGLQPGKTYNVFVLVEKRGPEWIAFTSFETLG
jgi:hypothetical protein